MEKMMMKKSDSQKEFGYKLMRPFVTIKFKNKYHPVVFGKKIYQKVVV